MNDEYKEATDAAMNYGQGYAAGVASVRALGPLAWKEGWDDALRSMRDLLDQHPSSTVDEIVTALATAQIQTGADR